MHLTCREVTGYTYGVVLLVGVAVIWVGASHLIKSIFDDMGFDRPFFLTYFNTCGFALWLLGACCKREWRDKLPPQLLHLACCAPEARQPHTILDDDTSPRDTHSSAGSPDLRGDEPCHPATPSLTDEGCASAGVPHEGRTVDAPIGLSAAPLERGGLEWQGYLRLALRFAPLWMAANYTFNLSLTRVSVATNSILSNTSALWTMLLSAVIFHESVSLHKVFAIFLTVGGACLVAVDPTASGSSGTSHGDNATDWAPSNSDSTSSEPADSYIGSILALVSALCYAIYTVFLRANVPDSIIMPIFFGYVGVVVLLSGLPVLLFLHVTSLERFSLPQPRVLGFLALNALIGTNLSDVLWAKGVVLTSPLVATLALSLTIPIGMASDAVLNGVSYGAVYIVGSASVLLGFLCVNIPFTYAGCAALCGCVGGTSDTAVKPCSTEAPCACPSDASSASV